MYPLNVSYERFRTLYDPIGSEAIRLDSDAIRLDLDPIRIPEKVVRSMRKTIYMIVNRLYPSFEDLKSHDRGRSSILLSGNTIYTGVPE